jgi:hypothetical protein
VVAVRPQLGRDPLAAVGLVDSIRLPGEQRLRDKRIVQAA